ncbi:MAG: SDR family NAD(P)-dependent oxidoreductase [Caulobacterales bacterium]|uniref:SDR family NAD(P)-dependent oxidoreductase n=1 Tax=Glycocaulis sp. TaxID=1969725 RepID=UPI003F9FF806
MNVTLSSLPENYRAVIIGASGGIGAAFVRHLSGDARCGEIHALSRSGAAPDGVKIHPGRIDLENPDSIEAALEPIRSAGPVHLVIVASGILHDEGLAPEKTWRHLDAGSMAKVLAVNTTGPALVAGALLDALPREGKAVFAALSARVGSISDNRLGGWHAYRASKAALNQIIRTCSVELARKRRDALIVGLHPGTVETALSEPFRGNVPEGKLFMPDYSARCLLEVIEALTPAASGRCYDWQGEEIAP